ncbi:AIG2-like protein D isoform X2 [Zingiber officinale]|uniref:AIG2-like protein D isoform X2 n=1 Tax=Zingiber officinale TaxID=94328 RepID=UPI001C4D6DFD|nr:AIG2-like protein D isoform X2 [Zingiber officinale]
MAVATNVSAPHTVFVYDTLMDDQVVQALLKHVPPSSSAVLNHYHRYSIKGRVYPAILPVETKKVTGKVLFGITNVELDVLDAFEDIEYERRVVEVSLLDKTEKLLVNAYVWSDKNDPNLYSEWDFEEWKRLHKEGFLSMTLGFMDEIEQPDSKTRVATYESYFQS